MKALSIRQPWASLSVLGIKDVENRGRRTNYRGPLLIHASGYSPGNYIIDAYKTAARINPLSMTCLGPLKRWLPINLARGGRAPAVLSCYFGAIIGQVDLMDCVQGHASPWAEPGAWHWVLANPKKFAQPVPYKGRLGLFDVEGIG